MERIVLRRNPLKRDPMACHKIFCHIVRITAVALSCCHPVVAVEADVFRHHVAPLLSRACFGCHNDVKAEGNFSVENRDTFFAGGDSGEPISVNQPGESVLLHMISGDKPEMPKDGPPLTPDEIAMVRRWIASGAQWPADLRIQQPVVENSDWWSLQPLVKPTVPQLAQDDAKWARTEIDAFVIAKLRTHQLHPSAEADRRTLVRRLYFDLVGLPPDFETVEAFVRSDDPNAYERLVDKLLASPHHGERWARHWLDVVHYGDTHGYDKDKPRPNAWPYRDYVIRSFNDDKPYGRFVMEQVAGDVLWPGTRDGIEATGFIAAGPWDFIGHAEVPESKLDGKVARNLDRDDMVSSTMNSFTSTTVQCARCHNHKFDPVTQEHYYSLQAVFAALDRADRSYDLNPEIARKRQELESQQTKLTQQTTELTATIDQLGGQRLEEIDEQLIQLETKRTAKDSSAFGYHSEIADQQATTKWVQIDLGTPTEVKSVTLVACLDDFAGIGEGFGFPVRFRVDGAHDPQLRTRVVKIADQTSEDFPNPKIQPVVFNLKPSEPVRYVRITATKLAERQNDFILAVGELIVSDADGVNLAIGRPVSALDSIEMPPRWQQSNLVDGHFFSNLSDEQIATRRSELQIQRQQLLTARVPAELIEAVATNEAELQRVTARLASLPKPSTVYCGTIHQGSGAFTGTGANGGRAREIRVLYRGDIQLPQQLVAPGTVPMIGGLDWRFNLPEDHTEGDRRKALARWLVRTDHPLTWRSIVNRVWQYHFGRAIVDSPNDFGRMGQQPTHPELLDWMAADFRDGAQSLKHLHRQIVTSSVYRQSSEDDFEHQKIDAENRYLWKANRRVLDAEAIRDSTLRVSGKLDARLFGPPFQDFVVERPEHSPHYEYHLHDPNDPTTHRRSIYRFLVRSQQQPFMQTLDCADPSESVAKRTTTLTSLQALAMMNNRFMIVMSQHLAARAEATIDSVPRQLEIVFQAALSRTPTAEELRPLAELARAFGLPYACRVILNLNEFVFVD